MTNSPGTPLPPPVADAPPKAWWKRWWVITLAALFGVGVIGSIAGGETDDSGETSEATAGTDAPAGGADPTDTGTAEAGEVEAESDDGESESDDADPATTLGTTSSSTTSTTSSTTTSTSTSTTTTTTEPPLATIGSGTYILGVDFEPGVYRVAGYWSLLDANFDIIDNDGVYDNGLGLVVVPEPGGEAEYVEISGEAVLASDLPLDVLAAGFEGGTYLVGVDLAPGRYRISDPDYAYAARLTPLADGSWDIIDNDGNAGSVIIEVRPTDYAFAFSGTIEPI